MDVSDESLANAAKSGDADAFGVLVERLYDRIFGLSFRLIGNRAEAEDLTQDICAALPSKLQSYRGEAKVTSWVYRLTVNAARDRFRRHASYAKAASAWGDQVLAQKADEAEAAEQRDWLTHAMQNLSEELRETVALVLDGQSHADAAAILSVSEGTISWRMSEVKKRLKAMKEADHE